VTIFLWWLFGLVVHQQGYSTSSRVRTEMGDRTQVYRPVI